MKYWRQSMFHLVTPCTSKLLCKADQYVVGDIQHEAGECREKASLGTRHRSPYACNSNTHDAEIGSEGWWV